MTVLNVLEAQWSGMRAHLDSEFPFVANERPTRHLWGSEATMQEPSKSDRMRGPQPQGGPEGEPYQIPAKTAIQEPHRNPIRAP